MRPTRPSCRPGIRSDARSRQLSRRIHDEALTGTRAACQVPAPERDNRRIPCISDHTGSRGFCYCGEGRDDDGRTCSRRYNSGHGYTGHRYCGHRVSPTARRCGRSPAVSAGHRRAAALRRALRRAVRPAGYGAGSGARAAIHAHGPVAAGRVRGHGAAGSGAEVVLADPGRDDSDRPGVPRWPARTGAARARAGDPGRPALDRGQSSLARRPPLVAQRASAAGRPARGRPRRTPPRC
jgi:hypothetical protein